MSPARRLVLTGLAVLLLASAGLLAVRTLAFSTQDAGQDSAAGGSGVRSGDPFAGTPAQHYPKGADGIMPPSPRQIGSWSSDDVQRVVGKAREALIAARLDPKMVQKGDPSTYLAAISEGARNTVSASLRTGDALGYVSRLAPGYRLLAPIRAEGSMTVNLGPKGELVIAADYIWIYPLGGPAVPGAGQGPGAKLVVVHTIETYQWFPPKGIAKKDTGLRPGAGKLYTFNMDCELARTGLLGLPRKVVPGAATAADDKAYDPATKPEELPNTC
jgi:hypothetical protein